MSMSEKLAQEEAAAQEEGDVLNFDDLDTNHDGAISRNELMDADEDQSHFTRASGGDEIPTKCEALCGREKGQSLRWKARRASARTFGVTVGLLVPCLFSVTLLGRDEYFRGSASSARQLIWNAEHRDPDDLFATITPEQVRTELDTGYARCGDDEPDCVERKDLNRTMTPQCWTRLQNQAQLQDSCGETNFTCKEAARVAWNRQCRVQPGVGVGVLSHNYTFYEHMMNNPWAVIFATFMFWVLYGLWYKIIMNATMEAHLEKFIAEVYEQSLKVAEHTLDATATVAGKVADTAGSVVDKAANLAGTDTELEKQGVISQWASKKIAKRDKEEQMKNGKRAFAIFIFVVTLGAALLTVYALIEGNAGNRYGLKIMDALGNIRIQSGQAAGEAGHNGSATKKMLSFGMGMIVAGGLVGAPTLTSFADKDTERRPVGKHKYWPLIGFFAFGIPFGLLCMWCEMELDQAEHHVLDSALNDDVRSRADIALKYQDPTYGEDKPPGYFAVQFSKLYREREHGFRTDMVQTLMCAVISLCWDVFVVTYHVIKPPHPKHRLRTDRRLSIYTHVFSGMGEIICSLASFWLYDEGLQNNDLRLRLTYMQVLCSYTHAWTGAFQTPQVFGMQCVMVPVRQRLSRFVLPPVLANPYVTVAGVRRGCALEGGVRHAPRAGPGVAGQAHRALLHPPHLRLVQSFRVHLRGHRHLRGGDVYRGHHVCGLRLWSDDHRPRRKSPRHGRGLDLLLLPAAVQARPGVVEDRAPAQHVPECEVAAPHQQAAKAARGAADQPDGDGGERDRAPRDGQGAGSSGD